MDIIANDHKHVSKCPVCGAWIFYNDEEVENHSVGGMIVKKTVDCSCGTQVPLYSWRCI